jgi:IPT/TIG domain-containing protein/List-Bact-rpt repeat protein
MHRSGGLRGALFGAAVFVAFLLVTGAAAGSSARAPRPLPAGARSQALATRIGHEGGIVLSRTPHAFSHSHAASPSSRTGAAGPAASQLGPNELTYHGGPVMHQSTAHAIFWIPAGYSVGANYQSVVDGYFQNVADASGRSDNDYSVAAQYGDTSGPGAYQVSFGGSVVDTDPFPANGCMDGPLPVCLTDAQLQAEIDKVISAHGWQTGLSNEFFIFTPPPAGSCFDSSSTLCAYSYYCAYHGSFTSSLGNGTVVYANQPYAAQPAAPTSCDTGARPNGDDADPEVNLVSHEQIESITDPLLDAWYDGSGSEIADKCAWNFGPNAGDNEQIGTGHYSLQQEWSNQTFDPSTGVPGACIQRDTPQLVLTGTGDGSVFGTSGVTCGTVVCDLSGHVGGAVTLTAQPAAGSSFLGWDGDCSGMGACTVTVTPATSVVARLHTSRLPMGWAEEPLAPPAGTDPFPQGSDPSFSFDRVAESEDGGERAFTLYHEPRGWCFYDTSDTGGIFLERQTSSGWVDDGKLTAPAVGDAPYARWPNCSAFGAEIDLSSDGSTLLASQDMAPIFGGSYVCAAFLYERSSSGWQLAGTLFPPGIGAAGSPTPDGCDYFGIGSVLSADGMRAAVFSGGRVDIYVRGLSGWSLEQHVVLPTGTDCGSIAPSQLAISGDGSRLLVGDPDCDVNGTQVAGRVYDYERAGSSWSLADTIDTPEPIFQNNFGRALALSSDGNTAAITTEESNGLPRDAGAVWVYEHTPTGWQQRVRLTTPAQEKFGAMTCPHVSSDGSAIVCAAADQVGFDPGQGSLYVFDRPGPSWTSAPTPLRLFAGDGHAQDQLAIAGPAPGIAVSPGGGDIAATIGVPNVGTESIGYEFTTAPVVRSFTPARAVGGAQVTVTGANFTNATGVTFDGVAASSFTVDSPTEITATVPATASTGRITLVTPGGSASSSIAFKPEPAIGSLAPEAAVGGAEVVVQGTNLSQASSVRFSGRDAHFVVESPTSIVAWMPKRARGGHVVVTTANGRAVSPDRFHPLPSRLAVTPHTVRPGGQLTITGANLGGTFRVVIDGRRAHFKVVTPTLVLAQVPRRARSGRVTVWTWSGSGTSRIRVRR